MTSYSEFRNRIERSDIEVIALRRGDVPLWQTYLRLWQLFQRIRPTIVHSRNLSGLDALIPAYCAGVPIRVHGEHGRDVDDLDGSNRKYQRLKRLFRPLVTHYTTVSLDLAMYLTQVIGVDTARVTQIYNGVDSDKFRPAPRPGEGFSLSSAQRKFVVGTVGRLQPVKDQVSLVKAFAEASRLAPSALDGARLVIVGEGPSRSEIETEVSRAGLQDKVALLGARDDVADVLRTMDLFVLPSLAEGTSNTILEAMASGLPVIATKVGGNAELVEDDHTGMFMEPGNWRDLATRIIGYASDPDLRERQGRAARKCVEERFSMDAMVANYANLYERLIQRSGIARARENDQFSRQ